MGIGLQVRKVVKSRTRMYRAQGRETRKLGAGAGFAAANNNKRGTPLAHHPSITLLGPEQLQNVVTVTRSGGTSTKQQPQNRLLYPRSFELFGSRLGSFGCETWGALGSALGSAP